MADNRLLIVANPISGSGRSKKLCEAVCLELKQLGVDVEVRWTDQVGAAKRIAQEASTEDWSVIAACGGDGTVHETINGLVSDAGDQPAFAVIPAGKGNDLARALGMPNGAAEIAKLLKLDNRRSIDLGRIEGQLFATVATLGFDAEVARTVHEGSIPFSGVITYVLAVLKTLATHRCQKMTLTGDFGVRDAKMFLAATANTSSYGGGMFIAPDAQPDDGLFDVCVIDEVSKFTVLRIFPKVFAGTHATHPKVEILRTSSLKIETDEPFLLFADGEPIVETPTTIEMLPKALEVVVP